MKEMIVNFRSFLIILLLIAVGSCSTFIREASNYEQYPSREKGCELAYFSKPPEDGRSYKVLGECKGKGLKGIIRSEYEAAYKRVEECACKNGGNAIILNKSYTQGGRDQYGRYTQTNAVVTATVIYIKE